MKEGSKLLQPNPVICQGSKQRVVWVIGILVIGFDTGDGISIKTWCNFVNYSSLNKKF